MEAQAEEGQKSALKRHVFFEWPMKKKEIFFVFTTFLNTNKRLLYYLYNSLTGIFFIKVRADFSYL